MTYEQAQKEFALREEWAGIRSKIENDPGMSPAARDAFHQRTLAITEELDSLRAIPAAPPTEYPVLALSSIAAVEEMQALRASPHYGAENAEGAEIHARMMVLHAHIERLAPMPREVDVTAAEMKATMANVLAAKAAGLPVATRVEMAKE